MFYSNVESCTGGTIPVGTSSSNCYSWSAWSDLSYVQARQPNTYSNVLTQVISPIAVRVGWVAPDSMIDGPGRTGDKVTVYYGTTLASVATVPYTGSTTILGGNNVDTQSENGISNTFTVTGLQVKHV